MPPHLHEICDVALLEKMLAERYVKVQHHPDLPLRIYNYTAQAQFERMWNPVTRCCRGLITNLDGRIVARPFAKFFNHGEENTELPDGAVQVTDKLDGSLGILYPTEYGHAIATRGSFSSNQALHATKIWRERYAARFEPNREWTYLFEIIYPANRIVVDYNGLDDLVLIGAVEIETGRSVTLQDATKGWPGPVVEEFEHQSLAEALSAPARPGREGVVVHFVESDTRVKIKHEEYVRMHRLVTGVSERRVWEALSEGVAIEGWLEAVPDEFYEFVTRTVRRLEAEHAALSAEVLELYAKTVAELPTGWGRKEFALAVTAIEKPLARALFLQLDGKSYAHLVWQQLRPAEHIPMFARGEDES